MGTKEMDSTVQMRLYTLTKRQFVLVFVAFFVSFFLTAIIGIAGPPIIAEHAKKASELNVPKEKFGTGPFSIDTGILSTFNQELWLLCQVKLNGTNSGTSFTRDFHLTVQILGRAKDSSYHLIAATPYNRSRVLRCNKECSPLVILHLGYIDYPSYVIVIRFHSLNLPKGIKINDIAFSLKHYNAEFTQVEIWFRFVFLVLTFMVTCMFAHSLRRFPLREWSIEQKWMSLLLPLLLLYNDPLFPLNFLVNSWVPSMFDSVFQASFLCALLLFWLCAFHGIRQSERKLSFYLPKLLIVGLLWVAAFTLSSWQQYNELQDPTYQYKIDIGHFMGLKVFFFTIGAIYLVYLVYLLFRAYSELRAMPYFDIRLKFLTGLMLIVLTISVIITGLRFGTGVLQENFVAELETHYDNSAEFLTFYGLLNFYLYTMAFVYSPSKNALYESYFRDQSTFSMLNESEDEESIYNSQPEKGHLASSDEED
ncbi:transmembrane protein 181-like [Montipora capricornis]|uniref:transmembrane protein 181-like n=1 Tax=Montipora foliosa TaxID=591990 RepID=UPI0035F1951C